MIDINKPVQTKSGKRVVALSRIPFNSAGNKVTFPIKGTIVVNEKPLRTVFNIWTDDGINDPVMGYHSDLDLVNVEN